MDRFDLQLHQQRTTCFFGANAISQVVYLSTTLFERHPSTTSVVEHGAHDDHRGLETWVELGTFSL